MAMGAANMPPASDRLAALERENETLREQLRRYSASQTVARGAILEAAAEREATSRMANQAAAEERATRAAVAVQGSNIGFAVVMQIISFFLLLILTFGLFVWLPRTIEAQPRPAPTPTVSLPGGGTVIPAR